jgi:hypothetical protein
MPTNEYCIEGFCNIGSFEILRIFKRLSVFLAPTDTQNILPKQNSFVGDRITYQK